MLIVIHNLPTKTSYSEVKALIRDRCNLQDLIVDNLVYEGPHSRKVTVGFSDENDANTVIKELNGLLFKGQKLYVEDLGKNKRSDSQDFSKLDQGYAEGKRSQFDKSGNKNALAPENQAPMQPMPIMPPDAYNFPYYMYGQATNNQNPLNNKGNLKGINNDGNINTWASKSQPLMQLTPSVPQYMQNNPYITPYYMYGQGSSYPSGMPQATNMTPTQPRCSAPGVPMMQNTNMGYSEFSNYGNNQQQQDNIPCTNENSQNEYFKKESGKRYFEEKNEQIYRNRGERPASSQNERGNYESRGRSNERRYDGDMRNSSDLYHRRSGSSKMSSRDDRYTEENPKQSRDSYKQSYDRDYKQEPEGPGYGQQRADVRRNEGNSESFGHDYSHRNYSNADNNYNRSSDTAFGNNTRFKWTKSKDSNACNNVNVGDYNDRKSSNSKGSGYKSNDVNYNPNPYNQNRENKKILKFGNMPQTSNFSKPYKPATYPTKTGSKYLKTTKKIEDKDETWRSQAVSKIVRDSLDQCGIKNLNRKKGFLPYLKNIVRYRIDSMIGKRVAVPFDKILEEYDQIYPPNNRKPFVLEALAKFNKGNNSSSEGIPIGTSRTVNLSKPEKRKAPEQQHNSPKIAKNVPAVDIPRPPRHRTPSPGPLPKYPYADKKANKKMKALAKKEHEKEIYTLEPKLKEALENEIKQLEELFKRECKNNKDEEEDKICLRMEKTSEKLMKVIKLDITKRLLNASCNLTIRMFANGRIKVRELGPKLKPFGIISCRKSARSKLCVVVCQDYPSYDYLCTQERIDVGDGLILTFKPLNIAGPKKKFKKQGNNANDTSGEEDEEHGDELAGDEVVDDDVEYDENDDNDDIVEIMDNSDELKIDQEDVKEVIDAEVPGNNQNTDCVEIVKPKDEPTNNENAAQIDTAVASHEDNNSDAKNLLNDIQELTKSIGGGDHLNETKDDEVTGDDINVSNILQDDLEDY